MDDFIYVARDGSSDSNKLVDISRTLADSLRTPEKRDQLSNSGDIFTILNTQIQQSIALNSDPLKLERLTQLCRVTANICLDNDTNRQKLLDAGVHSSVLALLNSLTPQEISNKSHSVVLRAAFGTLLNLSQDYAPSQEVLNSVDTLSTVFKFLNRRTIAANESDTAVLHSYIYEWGWRIVNNLLSSEHAKVEPGVTEAEALFSWVEAFQNDSITKTYTGLDQTDELQGVYEEDLSSLESATMLLETFAFDSETIRLCLADKSRLIVLLAFAETNELPRAYLESADNTTIDEWSKIYEECKSAVGKCIVGISSEDKLMDTLFDHGKGSFVQRMLIWLNNDKQRLNISGTLAIGNLARSEENTTTIVRDFNIIPRLVALLQGDDVKVSHASMSLLKNLSLPALNKEIIGKSGAIEAAQRFLSTSFAHVQPLQFATVGFYKHLCTQQLENTLAIVNHEPPILEAIITLINKSDDAGIKSEGTRVFVHGIKSCWMSTDRFAQEARSRFKQQPIAKVLVELLCNTRKYQILTNEAIMALTLLGSDPTGANYILEEKDNLASTIKQLLQDQNEVNKKLKLNICVFYSNLILKQTEQKLNAEELKNSLEFDIKLLTEDSDSELSKTAATVIAATNAN